MSVHGRRPDAAAHGQEDSLGRGPQKQDPSEIPQHTSGCDFLGVLLVLDTPFTAEQFARARASIEKRYKSEPVSGVGDEAYVTWDPRQRVAGSVHLSFRSGNKRISMEDLVPPDSIEAAKKWLIAFGKTAASRAK